MDSIRSYHAYSSFLPCLFLVYDTCFHHVLHASILFYMLLLHVLLVYIVDFSLGSSLPSL
jgi:hypothetical protein